ncbi:thioesterase family protein [Sphingobium cupriresistens]
MTAHFYAPDGDAFVPTELAASPWERGKQNGVALGGLLTHLIEQAPAPATMSTARLTIDILSATDLAPTIGRTRIVREGRRIQMVEAELLIARRVVARATALRVRKADTPVIAVPGDYPPPETVPASDFMGDKAFGGSMETRLIQGGLRVPGPGALWVKFGHEHVRGVALSPLVRTAILGDFGGGLGSELDGETWTYANLDIAVHLVREPVGEWLLIDARTASAGQGVARSDMILADRDGPFAQAHQTLFVAPRE